MDTWVIVLLIAVGLVAVYVLFLRKKLTKITVAKDPKVLHAVTDLVSNIPVVGKPIATIANATIKPVGKGLHVVNNAAISALKHVPIVGNVVAAPLKVAGRVGSAISGWLGF